jgi:hypothetical protein
MLILVNTKERNTGFQHDVYGIIQGEMSATNRKNQNSIGKVVKILVWSPCLGDDIYIRRLHCLRDTRT